MGEKHSAVGYLFREGAFLPAQETKPVRNEFGLDLFQHRGSVYEGKTGLQFCSLQQAEDLAGFVEKHGGIEKVQKLIADSLERTGLSPRYTRPDEKKKDIFPPKEKDENRVFAKDLMGNKHYYYRFYNENGIELYTMEKKREFFQTVYIPCDGFMVGIDQRHRLEEVLGNLAFAVVVHRKGENFLDLLIHPLLTGPDISNPLQQFVKVVGAELTGIAQPLVIEGKALFHVFGQDTAGPPAEMYAHIASYSITNSQNHVKIVKFCITADSTISFHMNL